MEKLSVSQTAIYLTKNGFPKEIVDLLAENFVDGSALVRLPYDDIDDFKALIPQTGLRLKLKSLIANYEARNIDVQVDNDEGCSSSSAGTSLATTISNSLQLINEISTDELPMMNADWSDSDADYNVNTSLDDSLLPVNAPCSSTPIGTPNPPSVITPNKQPACAKKEKSRKRKIEEYKSSETLSEAVAKELRLPSPCPLPTFTPTVVRAINNNNVKGVLRTRLLREACSFYYGLCPCPNHDEYVVIAKTLCESYPQLKDKQPRNGRYWQSVVNYASQKFRNLRRPPTDSCDSEKKKKVAFEPKIVPIEVSCDETQAGEEISTVMMGDQTAYERNMDGLDSELSKPVPEVVVVQSLMELTFHKRREDITTCSSRTLAIQDKYKFLKQKRWVLMEFELVCGKGIMEKIKTNWIKYIPKIQMLSLDKNMEENNEFQALQIIDRKLRASGQAAKQPAVFSIYEPGTNIGKAMKSDKIFSEPSLVIFSNEQVNSTTQAFIATEGDLLFEVDSFTIIEGLISLIASYYVFYIEYPKSSPASGVLLFIQEMLMEMPSAVKKTAKYTSFINSILD